MNEPTLLRAIAQPSGQWRLAVLGLAVVLGLVYGRALDGPLILDDRLNIEDNPAIRQLWPLSKALNPPPGGISFYSRPLVNVSMCINYALGGLAVRGYRTANVVVHFFAALALLGLVRRTLLRAGCGEEAAFLCATASAGVWAVHPLNTAAVNYLAQRGELFVGLFLFLMLYALNRAVVTGREAAAPPGLGPLSRKGGPAASRAVGWLLASVIFCLLGMGSKESMIVAPVLALAYDRIYLADSWRDLLRRRGVYYLLLVLTAAWPVSRFLAYTPHMPAQGFAPRVVCWYLLTQAWGLARMIYLAVWPHPLIFDYGTELATSFSRAWPYVVLVLCALAGVVWALWRHPRWGFPAFFFFVLLAPSSLMPITGQPVAEHRVYGALAGLVVLGVGGLYYIAQQWAARRARSASGVFLGMAVVWIVGLGVASYSRNRVYADELELWRDTVQKRPGSLRAHAEYGRVLCERGRYEEGLPHLERIREAPELNAGNLANLALALTHAERFDEAMACYRQAVQLKPGHALNYNNMAITLSRMGRSEQALDAYAEAIRLRPDYAEAHYNLGNLLFTMGRAAEALPHYREAVRWRPAVALNWYNLGITYAQLGQFDEAARCVKEALARDTRLPGAEEALQRLQQEMRSRTGALP